MSPDGFKAIRADASLADILGQVHAQSWQAAYHGLVPEEILVEFTPRRRAEIFKSAMADSPIEYYLFQMEEAPVGLAMLWASHEAHMPDTVGELYAIYFHPDAWGKGGPKQAMEFCLNRLSQLGFTQVNIWVLENNMRARRFYEKFGFLPDGREKELVLGVALKELCYTKYLPGGLKEETV